MSDDPYALTLPNLRALYLPDPGYALIEADLARADAQVIAWEAGATKLKAALANDEDIHSSNAQRLYGDVYRAGAFHPLRVIVPRDMHSNGMSYRDNGKRWVHATNFAGRARTVASTIVAPEEHVAQCQRWWLRDEHPEVGALHDRLEFDLRSRKNPVIRNKFGFRRLYVGGGDNTRQRGDNLLGQALAWIAQSTVAVTINHAMLAVDCARTIFGQRGCGVCMVCEGWPIELLMQHHDSLLCQVPLDSLTAPFVTRLTKAMRVVIPYDDPLIIPCEIKWSEENWGHMKRAEWCGSGVTRKRAPMLSSEPGEAGGAAPVGGESARRVSSAAKRQGSVPSVGERSEPERSPKGTAWTARSEATHDTVRER